MTLEFASPIPKHTYTYAVERDAITKHFAHRKVPKPAKKRLLLASWNIANLGVQGRTLNAKKLIAHILKRFDLTAVQEVKDELGSFRTVMRSWGRSSTTGSPTRLATPSAWPSSSARTR